MSKIDKQIVPEMEVHTVDKAPQVADQKPQLSLREQMTAYLNDIDLGKYLDTDSKYHGVTGKELFEMKLTPRKVFIDGYVASGLTLIAAPTGIGKSWVVLDEAKSIISGSPFLGKIVPQSTGDVIYIDSDGMTLRPIRDRLEALGFSGEMLEHIHIYEDVPSFAIKGVDQQDGYDFISWLAMKKAHLESEGRTLAAVIIDTIRPLESDRRTNGDAFQRSSAIYAPLNRWAVENGVAIIGTTHRKKGVVLDRLEDENESLSGAAGQGAKASCVIQMLYDKRNHIEGQEDDIILKVTKCREQKTPEPVILHHLANGKLEILESAAEKEIRVAKEQYKNHPIRKALLDLLKESSTICMEAKALLDSMKDMDKVLFDTLTSTSVTQWLKRNADKLKSNDGIIAEQNRRIWKISKK